ncbi:VOC family protein [Kribbella sp. DT2]|uniref:VOC family protein n=1 Tax=Kribbella sp. DT2 TaxID=3393427 RepID=UPI003CEE8BAF
MNDVVMRPLRFTADVGAMRVFLETLGLVPHVEGERGSWVDLLAGNGMVALHDAASSATGGKHGDTRLSFEADDIERLKDRLVAAGHEDATTWDEAYGRALSVTAPGGLVIWIDERSEDLYGYKLHQTPPDRRLTVAPHLSGAAEGEWAAFLEFLGVRQQVTFGPAGDFAVRLELRTTEPLTAVTARLQAAGYAAELTGTTITITDPDGQPVEVHG